MNPRYLLLTALLLLWALASSVGVAAADVPHRVLLLLGDDSRAYVEARDSFVERLHAMAGPAIPFVIEVSVIENERIADRAIEDFRPELIVAVGVDAARVVRVQLPGIPVVHALITREAHEGITNPLATALYIEQPFDRQFRLMRLTMPDVRNATTLLGPRSRHLKPELEIAARRSDIALHVIDISDHHNLVDAFESALRLGDVILAFPDGDILSPNQAKWLLYMAWQQETPVFGFSQAIVDAGAFAGLFTAPAQIGRDAAEQVVQMAVARMNDPRRQWRLPPPRYPRYFEVAVNKAVARALAIDTGQRQQLAETLRTIEQSDYWQAGQ